MDTTALVVRMGAMTDSPPRPGWAYFRSLVGGVRLTSRGLVVAISRFHEDTFVLLALIWSIVSNTTPSFEGEGRAGFQKGGTGCLCIPIRTESKVVLRSGQETRPQLTPNLQTLQVPGLVRNEVKLRVVPHQNAVPP